MRDSVTTIIDGVDVYDCENEYEIHDSVHCSDYISPCSKHPNCYFKQLKRKEQECEELKRDIETRTMCITCERELQNCNLQAENERLKSENKELESSLVSQASKIFTLEKSSNDLSQCANKLYQALQEIRKIAEEGLQSICYKANCATCRCYSKKISNDTLENIINDYFDEDGDFTDTEGDFFEVLQAFIDRERVACNKAQPISEKIISKINEVIGAE